MRPHFHSDCFAGDAATRPTHIPPSYDFLAFSSYLSERMSIALSGLESTAPPPIHRDRLLHFWLDTSGEINACHLLAPMLRAIDGLSASQYEAAGCWLDGIWHPDRDAMLELLWRIGAAPRVVGAAKRLHYAGNRNGSSQMVFA
jgi:hypothetical protein